MNIILKIAVLEKQKKRGLGYVQALAFLKFIPLIVWKVAGAGVLGYLGYAKYKDWKRKKDVENYINNPKKQNAIKVANIIHQAIDGIGTDEDVLFDVAKQITNIMEIREAYKTLFNKDLDADLKDDLSSEDFNNWIEIASK